MGECEEGSYQRGLSHCVEVTPQKTYWPPQWTASVSPSPPLEGKGSPWLLTVTPESLHV